MSAASHQLVHPSRPVRVGFVIDTLAPGSGTENQLLLLLRSFDRKLVVPQLCCLWDNPALADLQTGCRTEVLGFHRLYSPEGLRGMSRLRAWIKREMLDLVVTFFRDANLAGTIGAWSTGTAVISSRRNLGRGYWHNRLELAKLRLLNRMTHGFVANSRAVAEYTQEAEAVEAGRIEVIPNAIDIDLFRPPRKGERQSLRAEFGLNKGELLIVCVANLRPVKGHPMLLEAFARLLNGTQENSPPRLLLVGDGPDRPALETQCRDLGITERVTFLGSRADGAQLLRCADIGVLPSKAESLSNSLLEYLATGLPAVATDVGGNAELVFEGKNGHLVPSGNPQALADALETLCRNEIARAQMGRAARTFAENRFSRAAVLEIWYDYFSRMAGVDMEAGLR